MPSVNINPQTPQEKFDLIVSDLQEVLGADIIKAKLEKGETVSLYWGTATTGRPHCGYLVPATQIASFLRAGCRVKVLLADIHGFLDNLKAPIELVKFRAEYYRHCITSLLKAVGVSIEKLEFVLGSSYQLTPEFNMDMYRLHSIVSAHDAKRAGAEVVKQTDSAPLSALIYPIMQCLDEQYLDVDAQFGGVDQRKIFALAKEVLPKVGFRERAHLMNSMVPGLTGGKMSASDPDSKIDLLDGPEIVKKKLKKAVAAPKIVEENGVLSFVEFVLLPISALQTGEPRFVVERREGEPLVYNSIAQMHSDYREDILSPQILKPAVTEALNKLLQPIQADFQANEEWQKVEKLAYPPPPAPEKKVKVKKDKGSKFPGAAKKDVVAQPDGHVEGSDSAEVNVGKAEEGLKNLDVEEK
ncbi:tyrosyl-tRNA synthetase [Aureobasidium namibiae CBS 147.97]|uniref:Tyrosine--tRNA ligase n=1 Tax=Aureobasidium namibiae CBS 147.97 TaxID=1043004 RepID=A0A074WM32_9PEZI